MRALISILLLLACVLPAASQTVDAIVVKSVTEVDCRDMRNTRASIACSMSVPATWRSLR